jgi:hypothetical protein
MNYSKKWGCIILFLILILILFLFLFFSKGLYYSVSKKDGFSSFTYDSNSPKNSHNVDVVNNYYSCSNFCGPNSQCAITKEQCTSDVDCQGCQPPVLPKDSTNTDVKPLDDAGKLTWGQTPQYSTLTSDIGFRATSLKNQEELVRPYEGYDKWTKSFNYGLALSNKKLASDYEGNMSIPVYPVTRTVTGLFYDMGPTAANASL